MSKCSSRDENGETEGWIEAVMQMEEENDDRMGGKRNEGMSAVSEVRGDRKQLKRVWERDDGMMQAER